MIGCLKKCKNGNISAFQKNFKLEVLGVAAQKWL